MAVSLVNHAGRKGASIFMAIASHQYAFRYWQKVLKLQGLPI